MENYEGWKEQELYGYKKRLEDRTNRDWWVVDVYQSKKGYDRALIKSDANEFRRVWWDGIRWRWDGQRSRKGE